MRVGHETTDVSTVEILIFSQYQVFTRPKGQKVLKAIYGSPEKRTNKTKEIGPTLTCQIIVQQILLFFGKKTPTSQYGHGQSE